MKGIAKHTKRIIEPVSRLDCLKGWTLTGGTALAIQPGHRLSEDLDFMRW
ncbi:MAG: nucleotidyl transferase AbiEii/AbiGii toxin family protein [Alistipes sp.]|nr:nucleotidyl transferase AbiEii/AbiGii toxin family protein [Alistipes sp.]MCD8274779.1 nucleotidyl transferase AbiEii/AbiGii toxin family protein [Alistipes sp.]